MIEIIGTGGILPGIFSGIFLIGIGFFGALIGAVTSVFSSKAKSTASKSAEAERKHQLLMAKEATELAQLKAVQAEASTKKTMMYVGIGGGLFMMMMFMMMRK